MNKPAVLITNFRKVLSIGSVLEFINIIHYQDNPISLKELQDHFSKFNTKIKQSKFIDEMEEDQLLFKYNYVNLKKEDRNIYDKLVNIFMNQYHYDDMYVDKLRLIKCI